MHPRLSSLKTKLFNRRTISTILPDKSYHFNHSLHGKYSQIKPYTTRAHYQPRIQAPIHVDELADHTIEEMVAGLTPLEKATVEIFNSGNISHGSISLEAHTTLTEACNRIALALHGVKTVKELRSLPNYRGPMSGSGEGGQLSFRNDTLWDSLMKQIASGRFGITSEYLASCHEIQVKVAQGAKPGEGGQLPGEKVTIEIAFARLTEIGTTLISPSLNHDVSSIEDLKQLITDLRAANPKAIISVKLVMTENIGVIAVGTAKCGADHISIAGPGGTGAATITSKHEFTPTWEAGLAEAHQALIAEGLRSSVRLTVSGGIQTGEECFKAIALGADGIESATEYLVAMGCINIKKCHDGSCPTGIATTNQAAVAEKFKGQPQHVARILIELAKSTASYIEYYGYSHPSQVVGQTQLLEVKQGAPVTGLENLLYKPHNPFLSQAIIEKSKGSSYLEQTVIWDILQCKNTFQLTISNADLSFGARIAYYTHADENFKNSFYQQPITITFNKVPGQSFGFVAPPNLTMIAENANDGTGKSLDGASIYIKNSCGNQTGYGATRGEIFTRFTGDHAFVRNSGADLVCEMMGEMGINFMTGGSVTILGTPDCFPDLHLKEAYQPPVHLRQDIVGPNFGASFTGGELYLPKKLYESLYHHHYLASPANEMKPLTLTDDEVEALAERINKYMKEINHPFIHVLASNKSDFKNYFIKLSPKVKYENLPPHKSSVPLLVVSTPMT
jgi:glutamate synthase (NADPH/NADH) large chain